jgi:hypothetical protein
MELAPLEKELHEVAALLEHDRLGTFPRIAVSFAPVAQPAKN